ncbi:MAG: hypothetical protein ABIG64_02155 [Candidatus Omnitrophota bacterium]
MKKIKFFKYICVLGAMLIAVPVIFAQDVLKDKPNEKNLFQTKCAKCHSLDKSLSKTKTLAGWQKTTQRMAKKKNSEITREEAEEIAGYLADKKSE